MSTFLLWLAPVVVIAVFVWNYRKQVAAREAASERRLKEFLTQPLAEHATAPAASIATPNAAPASPTRVSASSPLAKEYAVREGLLTPPQKVLYYLLKTHLSDHEVLTKVGAAAFLDIPARFSGFERETRERRLALALADFVVCNKAFTPVAVVQCRAGESADMAHLAFARECSAAAGLRWVEVVPDAMPRREEIRLRVLGA